MQISQTRAKFQIQGLGNGLPGLLCILLAQAEIVGAVAPFAAAYCAALFLQRKNGYIASIGSILGALMQYPTVPMPAVLIPAALCVLVGLGDIYQQKTSRSMIFWTMAIAGMACLWFFQRDTMFALISGTINLALIFLFAIVFEWFCEIQNDYQRKGTLDEAQKLALVVFASGVLMGFGAWTFCGLSLFMVIACAVSLYTALYMLPSNAASLGLWTGFCGMLCGAVDPLMLGSLGLGALAGAFGSRVNRPLGTACYLLCFGTFIFLTHRPQLGIVCLELLAGTVLAWSIPKELGEKLAVRHRQKKSREEKPRLELVQQDLTKQLVCLSEVLSMTAQMIKETDPQGMGSLELRLAAKALRDSAKQARRGWFDSTAERMIRQRLTQRGMEIAGVAVQHGKGKSVRIEAVRCQGIKNCRSSLERLVSSICQEPMELESQVCAGQGRGRCCLQFARKNEMNVEGGVATAKKKGQQVNGDVFSTVHLGKGQELICLCDGMGSGTAAAETAALASRLIELFFEAGFDPNQVIPMVNRILSFRAKEVFAAVDLCLVDLVQGHCQMIKTGAAPSWIIRNGIAESITAPALPIGIVDNVRPGIIERSIEPGDTIVLLSDGIADLMTPEELPQWLGQVERAPSAAVAAEKLLAMARERAEGRDDMTAVVLRMQGR